MLSALAVATERQTSRGFNETLRRTEVVGNELANTGEFGYSEWLSDGSLKADSHIPCRSHAVPLPFPCRSPATNLPRTCHYPATTLPFSDSAVSFVKVRVVDGNIRTASCTV
jgi:hypothetical protein